MFDRHLSGEALATAPKFQTDKDGKNFWSYQGLKYHSVGLNAVVGRPFEEYGMEPTSLDQLRPGCYEVAAKGVDVSTKSSDGARPVTADVRRPITSGDMMRMFAERS
jgi:hypothetical protein